MSGALDERGPEALRIVFCPNSARSISLENDREYRFKGNRFMSIFSRHDATARTHIASTIIALFSAITMLFSVTACGQSNDSATSATDGSGLTKVTFMLSWAPDTNHIGVYVAKNKGYFKKAGLDVNIVAVAQAGAEQAVNNGVADFALSNLTNVGTYAIKGATITLSDTSDGDSSKVTIESSADETISTKLQEMVDAYNAVNEYIDTIYDSDPTLANTMKSVQRSLRSYLTGSELVNLGISTDWETGELELDTDVFSEAYEADSEGVIYDLFGDDDTDGVLVRLDDYLSEQTNATDGFLATKEERIDDETSRLEDAITAMETRLEKRRETLEAQFSAMEELISSLNSTGDYLTSFFEDYSSS